MKNHGLHRIFRRLAIELGVEQAPPGRKLLCTQLEDRTLMSVAPVDPALAAPPPAEGDAAAAPEASTATTTAPESSAEQGDSASPSGSDGEGTTASVATRDVVFLDSSAENYEQLLATLSERADADPSFSLVLLDDTTDGIEKVSQTLSAFTSLANVHFVTSGVDGALKLGDAWLSADTLPGRAGEIALWHNALQSDGNFLFYGHDLTATDAGAELLVGIAALTGDGVAAGERMMASYESTTVETTDVVLIDKHLDDVETLMKAVLAGDQVFLYDGSDESAADVLDDVVTWSQATNVQIASLTILSHGSPGAFALGDQLIGSAVLDLTADSWRQLSQVLTSDAVIDLYGCYVADSSGDGRLLIDALADLTGAQVFASSDATGAGGDWILEIGSWGITREFSSNSASLDLAVLQSYGATLASSAQGSETRANTTTSGTQEVNSGVPPRAVAMDASGNYVVVWNGSGSGDADGIFAQRYNASGVAQGAEFRVNTTTANVQGQANVAMDANGNFVITWTSDLGGTGEGVRAQRYDASGVAQGGEIQVNTTTAGAQGSPVIAMSTSGFVVAWGDSGADGSGYGVYAQRFDSSGTKVGGEFRVNSTTSGDQWIDSIAMNSSGSFIVTWSSAAQDGDGYGVYFKRYNSSGTAITGEVRANNTTSKDQHRSNVAMNDEGAFVITWTDSDTDGGGNSGVMAKRYNSSGTAQGTEFQVNTTTSGEQSRSTVGIDQSGNFVITWSSYNQDSSSTWGIYRRDYYADGTASSSETRVNTTTSGNQQYGGIAMNGAGQYVVAWSGNGTGDTSGVFFQRYTETNQAPVNTVAGAQWASGAAPLEFSSANGNAISISDADGGTYDHQVTLTVSGGALTLATTSGLSFVSGDGTADATMTFTGSISSINAALNGLSYTATPFFSGADTLQIVTSDLANVGTGSALTDTDTVTINVAAAGTPYVITGSYTGDGTDNRNITGIGFQPDVVLIKARTNQIGVMRTSAMTGDVSKDMTGATTMQANLIQSLLSDGFQLGTDASVNSSGVVYDYIVFKASAGFLTVGSYTGNGTDNRAITGLGLSPDALFIMDGANQEAVFSTTADEGNAYNFNNGGAGTNHIQSLDGDGFTLGNDNRVNQSGHTYYYIAWNEMAGAMDVGSYTGNGADNRNITGVGFQSEWLMVQSDGKDTVAHFDSQGATTDTSSFLDATASTTNRIQQLQSDGFQVGTDADVNSNGTFYQYLAFKQQTQVTLSSISDQTILEDGNTGAIAFTIGDAETSASNLSVRVTSSNSTLAPAGSLVLGGSGANRTLTITPVANENGTATITVEVTDGATITSRTFTLTVTAVNDQPVRTAGSPAAINVYEDTAPTTAVALGLSGLTYGTGGGSDEAGQALTYTVTAIPSFVTVWLADGTTQVTTNTTLSLAQLQGLKYKTVGNAVGSGNLTWTVQDSGGTANGGVNTLTENLSITVNAVNDAPVRTAGSPAAVNVNEDSANTTAVALGMSGLTYGTGGGSDESAQTLTYTVTAIPSFVTLWLADGTTQVTANTTLSLTQLQGLKYKTVANAVGTGNLTWTVQDSGGTANGGVDLLTENLSITVGAVNDVPVRTAGSPAAVNVNEDSANGTAVTLGMSGLAYSVGGGDDESGQTLSYTVTSIPSFVTLWLADGTTQVTANTSLSLAQLQGLKYKTVANAIGAGDLTWTVQDSGGTANGGVDLLTENLSITVGAVNDQPVRTTGSPAAVSVSEDSANATAVTLGMSGLTYGVGGGSDEAAQSLTYTVTSIPSFITVWLADGTTQVTANTTLSLAQIQGLKYKTVANAIGTGNLTWTVQDSGGTANGGVDLLTENLSITVGAVNDQPIRTAGTPAAVSVAEDSANVTGVSLGMNGLIYGVGGGSDEAGQTLTYTVTSIPSFVTLWLADGATQVTANTTLSLAQLQGLKYKTVANVVGNGNLTWTVQDSGGTANGGVDLLTENLSITVGDVNDQPIRTAGSPTAIHVDEDSANATAVSLGMSGLTYGVGGGSDEAGQTLTYTVTSIPSFVTLWLADGTTQVTANTTLSLAQLQGLKYKTVADAVGTGNLIWTVQDSGGTAGGGVDLLTENLSITVGDINDQPIRTSGSPSAVSVNEDGANSTAVTLGMSGLTYGVGGGADEAAQTLTYTITSVPSCVTLWLADGTTEVTANTTLSLAQLQGLKYKTVANAVGAGNLTWTVQDSGGTAYGGVDLLTETLAITVGAVNDQPIRTAGSPAAVSVGEDSANTTAVTLGMSGLMYGVGGGADESAQSLTYTLNAIPSFVTLWLADGTTQVTANTTLSLAQLQGLKYKTVADAVGTGNLTWTVQDNGGTANGGVDLLTESLSITVGDVNDAPVRTAGSPAAISVAEDSANTTAVTLGMSGLIYGVGGGGDEAAQTLTYTVTSIPSCVTLWLADGTTQVTANTTLSLAQLQGLKYKTVADAVGTGNLIWTVQDSGGTAAGGVDLLTESLSITVGDVNDRPVRTAGSPVAIDVVEDSANATPLSLGLSDLTYDAGGGSDEAAQNLTYTITGIPSCITVWLADGTTQVTSGMTLSLEQLQGLQYLTVADAVGGGNLTWTVQDSGGTAGGGVDTLTESLAITVGAVNDQPVRTAGNPAAINVGEDSANVTALTLGMNGLTYGVGGGADETAQSLTYTVTAIPSLVTLWLADGTTQVAANTTLSLAQLRGLKYKTVADAVGTGNLTWTVQDNGGTAAGGVDLLTESLSITVGDVNDRPIRASGNPTAINVDEDGANTTAVSLGLSGLTYDVGGGGDEAAQTLTYTVTSIPSCVTLWLADGTTQVTANASLSLAQLQGLKYKTVADAVGTGNLTWTVQDDGGTANGGIDLLTETLAITVGDVNDQPIRTAGSPAAIQVDEDSANATAVTLGMSGLTYGVGGAADEAGQTLSYTVTAIPSFVTLWLADGTTQVTANTTLSLAQLQGLKYKTVADAVGTGNLTWTVQDDGGTADGGIDLLTETLAITVGNVNDQPLRTAGNPAAINVGEDSANTTAVTLGMGGLTYGVGGAADEAGQTLTYTVTSIPSFVTLWLADGTTQVTANTTLSLAQLQGLKYKTVANAVGAGNIVWSVQDDGGTANGGSDLLSESLAVTVGSVNDQPVRIAGAPTPIGVAEDSANATAVTLGMSGLTYGVGGGSDEAGQSLAYTVTAIPSFVTLWLADGTTQVAANTTLSLAQLQGLKYKTVADAVGTGNLTWTVQDSGGTAGGGIDLLTESLSITVGDVNDQPVRTAAAPAPINVAEDSANTTAASLGLNGLTYSVGGAGDEAGQTLAYTVTAIPSFVTLWLADGTTQVAANTSLSLAQLQGLKFKTVADAVGTGNLTWTVQDDGGTANGGIDTLTESLSITVGDVNDQPVRTAGSPTAVNVSEDSANTTAVTLGMSGLTYAVGGGADESSQGLTYTVTAIPSFVTLWLADGTTQVTANTTLSLAQLQGLKYKTVADAVGTGNLVWTVQDSGGTAGGGVDLLTETLSITVGDVNDQPVRTAGSPAAINVNEDGANTTAVTLGMSGLTYGVGGAGDEAGQSLTYTVAAIPSFVTLWLADGTTPISAGTTLSLAQLQGLKYKTVADAVGTGNLTWTVQDDGGTVGGGVDLLTESLSITVSPVNDVPVRTAGSPAAINIAEDGANATALSLGLSGLTYGVGGGGDEAGQSLTYTVTAVPSFVTLWLADGTTQVSANATLSLAQLQGLKYRTVADAVGSGDITWTVQDSGGTTNGGGDALAESLNVTVGAVNDQPIRTAGSPAAVTVEENSANSTAVTLGLSGLAYDVGGGSDEAGQSLTYTVTAIPSHMTLWLADGTTQVAANTTLTLAQLQGLKFKTVASVVGSGNLTWTVRDNGGTAGGGSDTLTESLTVTVGGVNDAPIRTAGSPAAVNVAEDSANTTAVSLGLAGLAYGPGGGGDESAQTLTYTVTAIPSFVTLWLADGTTQVTANTGLSLAQLQGLTYKTVTDAVGTGNLTWTVQDDGGTVNGGVDLLTETLSITVGDVNDQPVRTAGSPAAIHVDEDSANSTAITLGMSGLAYGVGGAGDEAGQTLTYTVTAIPSFVTLWLADGTTQIAANTTLSLAQLQGLKYKTVADAVGTGSLTWTVQDSGGTANGGFDLLSESLSITVGNVNDQPIRTAGSPAAINVGEDAANVTAVTLGLNGIAYGVGGGGDESGQSLSYMVTAIPSFVTLWLADGTTQVIANTTLSLAQLQGLAYKTVADAVGTGNLVWTVQDSGGIAGGGVDLLTEHLSITVGAVNDRPIRTTGSPSTINVGEDSANLTAVTLGMSSLTYAVGGASDEAAQTLTYTVTAIPSFVTLWLADGTTQVTANTTLSLAQLQGLKYKTVADAVGTGNLTWTVQDSGGSANGGVDLLTENLSITVGDVNDQPVRTAGTPSAISVAEDSANATAVTLGMGGLTYGVGGGGDESGQSLSYTVTAIPSFVTLWRADGTTQVAAGTTLSLAQLQGLKYKTVADAVGTGNLIWTVHDDGGTANGGIDVLTETLAITVGDVNDQPVRTAGSPAPIGVAEGSADITAVSLGMNGLAYGVGGAGDEAGQTLTYTLTSIPSFVTVWLADGTTQITANTTLSLAQLQGLKYKTVADAVGTGNLTWTVQDSGGTADGGVDLLTESLAITVGAVNDAPVRTAGSPAAVNVNEDSANTTAVTLDLGGLTYGVGGAADEAAQSLTYTVTAIPSFVTLWLADGTTQITENTTLSLAQLQGLKYKTVADAVGTGNLTWTVQDSGGTANGGVDLLTETLSITVGAVNDVPVRTAGSPTAINIGEDSANTTAVSVGLAGIGYGVGGAGDEAGQSLTYTLTSIPSCFTLWLADGTTQVTANTTLSLAQLQGLKYKTVANAVGTGNLTWNVQDDGGTVGGGVDLLTESLSITVGAMNDQPIRTSASPAAINVDEDAANTTAVTLGLSGLTYGVGGASDEAGQSLSYTVTAIPPFVTLWLADGTTQVTANTSLSLAQLQGLTYKTVADAVGTGNLIWTVQDSGGTANGGVDTLVESLAITVSAVNDQPVRASGVVGNLIVSEDSPATSLGLAGLTYSTGGGADEASQTFTITVTAVPPPSLGHIVLADGTTVVSANATYTLAELQGMQFRTSADAYGGPALFAWTVRDSGGTSAGGVDTLGESLTIGVSPMNDAPVLNGANDFTTIGGDQTANSGDSVASLIAGRTADVDVGAAAGIAVTGLAAGGGTWQYSTDGGSSWAAVGSVSDASALLLQSSDRIRFVPGGLGAQTASITFRAWDQTGGVAGTKVDASTNGGTTAFSSAAAASSINVTAVNVAPPAIRQPGAQITRTLGLVFSAANGNAISVENFDLIARPLTVTLATNSGHLTLADRTGLTFLYGDGLQDQVVTLSGSAAAVNAALDGLRYEAGAIYGAIHIQAVDGAGKSASTTVGITQVPLVASPIQSTSPMPTTGSSQFTGDLRTASASASAEPTSVVATEQTAANPGDAERTESSLATVAMVLAPSAESSASHSSTVAAVPAELIMSAPIDIADPAAIPIRLSESSFQDFTYGDSIAFHGERSSVEKSRVSRGDSGMAVDFTGEWNSAAESAPSIPTTQTQTSPAESADNVVAVLTSSLLVYPTACEQVLPSRQVESADAYVRSIISIDAHPRKREDRD